MPHNRSANVTVHDYSPATAKMRDDVLAGLMQVPKRLPSQYLYDRRGAELFEEITQTPEYYLTSTELAILREQMPRIAESIGPKAVIIEPGSGAGEKVRLLIGGLENPAAYIPIDVACVQLERVANDLNETYPTLHVLPVCADFTGDYILPPGARQAGQSVVFFPGSTIGNFQPSDAIEVLNHLAHLAGPDGAILLGVDLKKPVEILEPAYDDAAGVSAAFALNYLVRLNNELDAEFCTEDFEYEAPYNKRLGRIEMALVSRREQTVHVDGTPIRIRADERIATEWSYKYTPEEFDAIAANAGLRVRHMWVDQKQLFSVQYLTSNSD